MFKVRIILFAIFVGLFSLSLQFGAMTDVSDEEANDFVQEFLSQTESIDGAGIFLNNALASFPMFVPGFGMAWGLYTGWSTGYGFAALVTMAPGLSEIQPLSILYMSPFGLIELAAYSIAMSRSFYIIYALIKRINPLSLIKYSLIEIGVVAVLLLTGAYLEEYLISLAQESSSLFG